MFLPGYSKTAITLKTSQHNWFKFWNKYYVYTLNMWLRYWKIWISLKIVSLYQKLKYKQNDIFTLYGVFRMNN